jgi:hypothetical protein
VLRIARDRHDVDGLRLVRVHVDREAEIGGQVTAHLVPRVAGVVAAHDVPVLLHEEHVGTRGVDGQTMHAVPHIRVRIRDGLGVQSLVDWTPALATVVAAERPGRRYRDVDPPFIAGTDDDGVQAHSSRPGLPGRTGTVLAKSRVLLPALPTVRGAKEGRVLDASEHGVGVAQ